MTSIRPIWISDNSVFGLPRGSKYMVTSTRKATAQLPDGSFVTIDGNNMPKQLPDVATEAAQAQFSSALMPIRTVQNDGW